MHGLLNLKICAFSWNYLLEINYLIQTTLQGYSIHQIPNFEMGFQGVCHCSR